MSYLITQIIVWLLIAFLVGFAIGWLFRDHGVSTRMRTQDNRWRQRLRTLEDERDRAQALSEELNVRVNSLGAELGAAAESAEQLGQKLRRCQDTVAAREMTIGNLEKRIVTLENSVEDEKVDQDEWDTRLNSLQRQIDDRDREIAGLQTQLQTKSEALSDLENEARKQRQTLANLSSDSQDRAELEKLLADKEQRIASLEIDLEKRGEPDERNVEPSHAPHQDDPKLPSFRIEARPGVKDDLKRIHGIGPVLEGMLNALGISQFSQIAAFTADDIHWVTDHIDAFPDRIVRDKWVEQATELAARKE